MEQITVPPPDEIRRRITACEDELKALRRLLRISHYAETADKARQRRGQRPEVRRA
jgi:hypothetical protein